MKSFLFHLCFGYRVKKAASFVETFCETTTETETKPVGIRVSFLVSIILVTDVFVDLHHYYFDCDGKRALLVINAHMCAMARAFLLCSFVTRVDF